MERDSVLFNTVQRRMSTSFGLVYSFKRSTGCGNAEEWYYDDEQCIFGVVFALCNVTRV